MAGYQHLLAIRCGGCSATWAGESRAHCARCHRTWDNVDLFDTHLEEDRCLHPRTLGLVETKNHIWYSTE
ncbi:hypothetical protein GCM10023321_25920 [Pseudonocardia eucalypti]|uniref:Phage FDXHR zinc binding domain-containing protein n=1 Tax=Pseudonocardia eucalypti TaxID=648755 RepID=A0ABP9PZ21_9PSEU